MRFPAPWAIRDIDLSEGVQSLASDPDGRPVFTVFRWRRLVLGTMAFASRELPLPVSVVNDLSAGLIADALATRAPGIGRPARPVGAEPVIDQQVRRPIADLENPIDTLDRIALDPPGDAADLSVIVCTRGRSDDLARCLAALDGQEHPPRETIVVDNNDEADTSVEQLANATTGTRYIHEPRRGLSIARNTGLRASVGGLIAFTDDDAEPDTNWTGEIARPFSTTDASSVTGLVLPATLASDAQVLFQHDLGGFGTTVVPVLFDQSFLSKPDRYAAHVWRIGAGANMAFRRSALEACGLFDERLGAGAAGCSEDSEIWYRILAQGGTCLYEPRAVVRHRHREDMKGLRKQMNDYMRGHTAALVAQYDRHGHRGNLRRTFVDIPSHLARSLLAHGAMGRRERSSILWAETKGWFKGLFYLAKRQWRRNSAIPSFDGIGVSQKHPEQGASLKASMPDFLKCNPFPGRFTDGLFYREKMRAIHRIAPADGIKNVLEVGGGRSGLSSFLYPGAHVVSLDIAPPSRGELPDGACPQQIGGDARQLPFADGTFDAVTLFDVIEHVVDDQTVVSEAQRVVRSGGTILLSTPNENWRFPYYKLMKPLCPDEATIMAEWGHVRRGYTLERLSDMFGAAPEQTASFINPLTALAHDISFANLRRRYRMVLHMLVSPISVLGYALGTRLRKGTETAAVWRKPET